MRKFQKRLLNGNKQAEKQSNYEVTTNSSFISWELMQRILLVLTLLKTVIGLFCICPDLINSEQIKKLPPITTSPNTKEADTECPKQLKAL